MLSAETALCASAVLLSSVAVDRLSIASASVRCVAAPLPCGCSSAESIAAVRSAMSCGPVPAHRSNSPTRRHLHLHPTTSSHASASRAAARGGGSLARFPISIAVAVSVLSLCGRSASGPPMKGLWFPGCRWRSSSPFDAPVLHCPIGERLRPAVADGAISRAACKVAVVGQDRDSHKPITASVKFLCCADSHAEVPAPV